MAATLRSNNNVVYQCAFHVVWCTKYRRKLLTGLVEDRLKEILTGVAAELDCPVTAMESMPDHIHLLIEVDPQFGVHRLVKAMKGRSSRLLRAEFPHIPRRVPTLWTNSYFVATTGGAPLAVIKQFVESQKDTDSRKQTGV